MALTRLTAGLVKKAYKDTGAKFCNQEWFLPGGYCCPAGVVALHKGFVKPTWSLQKKKEEAYKIMKESLGTFYLRGFTIAIDRLDVRHGDLVHQKEYQGYEDGKAVLKALAAKRLVK